MSPAIYMTFMLVKNINAVPRHFITMYASLADFPIRPRLSRSALLPLDKKPG